MLLWRTIEGMLFSVLYTLGLNYYDSLLEAITIESTIFAIAPRWLPPTPESTPPHTPQRFPTPTDTDWSQRHHVERGLGEVEVGSRAWMV